MLFGCLGLHSSCATYATVYAMPTQPQWEPTRLIPLKVCLRKPNARVNRQCTFVPTPSHFRLLLEGSKRNFCLRDHSPINIFVNWHALQYPAGAPVSRLQSAHCNLQSVTDILQPHPAAAPAPRFQSALY